MDCPKCQTVNPDDSKYCKECAAPLTQVKGVSFTVTLKAPKTGLSKGSVIADKYKIIEEIGRGGMGVVSKAEDTRLDRTVALKFLSSELTQDEEAKQRFVQEAKAAAALNHPNISIIHEIDEHLGQTFIAMEYIQGRSLKHRLEEGPLDVEEAKDIALQVAEGLKEAHDKGIIHRDIKPANIMLTEKGQAKITDFGLAKLSGGADLTKASTIMGTVAYMSPEQAKGEAVDHRTDIWSLAAMLYEMLSGERPFQKAQEQALIYAILNDKPTPLSMIRSDIPSYMEKVIEKALAKKSKERYQDVHSFILDLRLSQKIAVLKAEKSIVVLPFENLSPDPDQEYFCDGITEEIISDLSRIKVLRVISRSSAMTFKNTKKKIEDISRELDVQYALEGSVRKAGNKIRITAQLIDAKADSHIWSEKYSGELDDIFDIQERVSNSIAEQLKIELTPEDTSKARDQSLDNAKAYDCYLQARYEILKATPSSIDRARHLLQRSIDIIGESALLYAALGQTFYWYHDCHYVIDLDPLQEAEKYAEKAYAINPNLASVHFLYGLLERGKGNLVAAVKHIKQAVDIDPGDSYILSMFIWTASLYTGKTKAMKPYSSVLLDIDPFTPFNYMIVSAVYMAEGQWDKAADFVEKSLEMDPGFRWGYFWLVHILARVQNHEEFHKVADRLFNQDSGDGVADLIKFFRSAYDRDKQGALEAFTKDFENFTWNDPEGVWLTAGSLALIEEKDKALKWLEHAVERGWINYPLFAEQDPLLENIRGEPRFKKLMERVKHEWENFEV